MRTSLVLALAAGSVVASGVALSLQVTPSTSSHSSTIADEATTVSKVDRVAVVAAEPPQDALPAAVQAPSLEASRTAFLSPSIEASQPAFYEVAEEASEDRTALAISSGPPVVVAARAEKPIDQASSDQPAPAPKSTKQKNAKTTAKKPLLRDSATKEQQHAKAMAAPERKEQAIASNQEPATSDVQEAPSAGALPNPISKLRELFGGH